MENRRHGYVDEQLSHLLSYIFCLFNQINIVLDSILHTYSRNLIWCFNLLTGRSELDECFKCSSHRGNELLVEINKCGDVGINAGGGGGVEKNSKITIGALLCDYSVVMSRSLYGNKGNYVSLYHLWDF